MVAKTPALDTDITTTAMTETYAETFHRWRRNVKQGLSYLFLYGYPHVSTDFFAIDFEAPDYIWFMIIFVRMVLC